MVMVMVLLLMKTVVMMIWWRWQWTCSSLLYSARAAARSSTFMMRTSINKMTLVASNGHELSQFHSWEIHIWWIGTNMIIIFMMMMMLIGSETFLCSSSTAAFQVFACCSQKAWSQPKDNNDKRNACYDLIVRAFSSYKIVWKIERKPAEMIFPVMLTRTKSIRNV